MANLVFLHGLDSSSQGTKARFFRRHFPAMIIPDFAGPLAERLATLAELLAGKADLTLIGSSFGGLMATIFALEHPARVRQVVLLAPALNFPDFFRYQGRTTPVPAHLVIGIHDSVTPSDLVIPLAREAFPNLRSDLADDDHLLHRTFPGLDWQTLLY